MFQFIRVARGFSVFILDPSQWSGCFFSLQNLPKGDELLISHYNPEVAENFANLENELHENIKVYLKAKSERTKAFQDRFKK